MKNKSIYHPIVSQMEIDRWLRYTVYKQRAEERRGAVLLANIASLVAPEHWYCGGATRVSRLYPNGVSLYCTQSVTTY